MPPGAGRAGARLPPPRHAAAPPAQEPAAQAAQAARRRRRAGGAAGRAGRLGAHRAALPAAHHRRAADEGLAGAGPRLGSLDPPGARAAPTGRTWCGCRSPTPPRGCGAIPGSPRSRSPRSFPTACGCAIAERKPVALLLAGSDLVFADAEGRAIAPVGDAGRAGGRAQGRPAGGELPRRAASERHAPPPSRWRRSSGGWSRTGRRSWRRSRCWARRTSGCAPTPCPSRSWSTAGEMAPKVQRLVTPAAGARAALSAHRGGRPALLAPDRRATCSNSAPSPRRPAGLEPRVNFFRERVSYGQNGTLLRRYRHRVLQGGGAHRPARRQGRHRGRRQGAGPQPRHAQGQHRQRRGHRRGPQGRRARRPR